MATYETPTVSIVFWPNRKERMKINEKNVSVSLYVRNKENINLQPGDKVLRSSFNGVDEFLITEIKDKKQAPIKGYTYVKALCIVKVLTTK